MSLFFASAATRSAQPIRSLLRSGGAKILFPGSIQWKGRMHAYPEDIEKSEGRRKVMTNDWQESCRRRKQELQFRRTPCCPAFLQDMEPERVWTGIIILPFL